MKTLFVDATMNDRSIITSSYNIIRKEDKKRGNNNIHTVSLARSSGFSKPVG
jgi:hypothetical protein